MNSNTITCPCPKCGVNWEVDNAQDVPKKQLRYLIGKTCGCIEKKGPMRRLFDRVKLAFRVSANKDFHDDLDARIDGYHDRGGAR